MPNWTLRDLTSRATRSIGRRADIALSDVSFWVNEAYRAVLEAEGHGLQERIAVASLISGENKIQLPTDLRELLSLSYLTAAGNSRRTFNQISPHEVDARFNADAKGQPTDYALFNDWLEVVPSPDSSYSIQMRYYSEATDLVALADIPSIDTPFRHAIYLKTKELLLGEHLGRQDEAAFARNAYIQYMASIPNTAEKRQRTQARSGLSPIYVHPKGR